MDVLIVWEDGSKNVVSSTELKSINCEGFKVGNKVKMQYKKKWYKGTVVATENDPEKEDYSSEDEIPLSKLLKHDKGSRKVFAEDEYLETIPLSELKKITGQNQDNKDYANVLSESSDYVAYDSDADPPFGICESRNCKNEVWAACHRCEVLLCFEHFDNNETCLYHTGKRTKFCNQFNFAKTTERQNTPELFLMDGEARQGDIVKPRKINKQALAKTLRNSGEAYVSPCTIKNVPGRYLKVGCDAEKCKKIKKMCYKLTEEERGTIFRAFNEMGDLHKQREFLVRHVETSGTRRKTTSKEASRRHHTLTYKLTLSNTPIIVCKEMFLATFGISEKMCRVALSKVNEVGILEKEKRGGRQRSIDIKNWESNIRNRIELHINRFPKVESHFCRAKTSRMYLHPDLSLQKMYSMFIEELDREGITMKPSYHTYRRVFRQQNLSFLTPKKDQCSLCLSFLEGDEQTKQQLKDRYDSHIAEKTAVREKKIICKQQALENPDILSATFDLQQVIYLPISKASALFYKSRLSNFNLTFYDIATRDCYCFVWNESVSKRGSSEIASCIYKVLQDYNQKSVKRVCLFADGCYGQNKNTVVAAMLIYSLSQFPGIEEISLRYFETNHGQNEGDSAHSAISSAISKAGDIFVPSQLYPIKVVPMIYSDFKNFKLLSQELRILSVRQTEKGQTIKWPQVMEIMVTRKAPMKIFFKNSHLQNVYDSIALKRFKGTMTISALNKEPQKITKKKYEDLMSLCTGSTPVIRNPEYQQFFMALPHETE